MKKQFTKNFICKIILPKYKLNVNRRLNLIKNKIDKIEDI